MILKFLKNKKGGSTASIDYLLDKKRVQNGTAKILKGNEKHTRDIIKSITKKQKVTFGVLSFEEKNIPEEQKQEIMNEFEKTFFAGMKEEQYNILWVEHTDKNRLELNFIIPKIELSTGKSFNPYYHKTDFHLADLFQKKMNLKYNFTDPQDPAKQSSIQGNKKALGLFRGYRNLDKKLKELVADGVLQSRDDIISILRENNIEITKIEKDKIEVKLEGSKKPRYLKGGIYADEFRATNKLREIGEEKTRREREFANRDNEEAYRRVSERLEKAVSKRAIFNAECYRESKRQGKRSRTVTRNNEKISKSANKTQQEIRQSQQEINRSPQEIKEIREIQDRTRRDELFTEIKEINKGELNDIRRRTLERIRERTEVKRRAYAEAKRTRIEIYNSITNDARTIQAELERNNIEARGKRESIYERAKTVMRHKRSKRNRRQRFNEKIRSIRERFNEFSDTIQERFRDIAKQSAKFIATVKGLARNVNVKIELKRKKEILEEKELEDEIELDSMQVDLNKLDNSIFLSSKQEKVEQEEITEEEKKREKEKERKEEYHYSYDDSYNDFSPGF